MKTLVILVCLAAPPLVALVLYVSGALTIAQFLQSLPFAWPAASVLLWIAASLLLGVRAEARPPARSWSAASKGFHWITALAVLGTTALMYYMVNMGDLESNPVQRAEYGRLLRLHKSIGLLALFLLAARLAWLRRHPRPPLPSGMTPREQRLAALGHAALYAGLLVVPMLGWTASMTYGAKTNFFGLFEMPVWLPKNVGWSGVLQPAHIWIAWGLLALVGGHVAAAFWHHLVRRDATLVQMLPKTPAERHE